MLTCLSAYLLHMRSCFTPLLPASRMLKGGAMVEFLLPVDVGGNAQEMVDA